MKIIQFAFLLLPAGYVFGQDTSVIIKKDSSDISGKETSLVSPVKNFNQASSDTALPDGKHNMYGDLLNDDPAYNKKSAWWVPALRVIGQNVITWTLDRYLLNADFARIGPKTWKRNLKEGWEWDADRFGINFIGHPYSGSGYFNIARSNGYSFWQSFPYAVEGSLMWEYFGENTRPSYNDVINTPVTGAFLGEILYRLSSNILDDSKRGGQRVWREILAGIIDPSRAFNRFTQGKMKRVVSKQIYQKEPLNVTLYAGIHQVNNENNKFGSGQTNEIFNLQLDYGNPFENRFRKPFDLFRLRTELSYGVGRKLLDNITGYGILFGKNIKSGEDGILIGGFQHFDYWDNKIFELGTIGFGGSIIARVPIAKYSNFYYAIHVAGVPLAGNSTRFGPDSSEFRDYNFGGGFEGKLETTLNMNAWSSLGFNAYYYFIHTYVGIPGNSIVGILKPKISLRIFKNLSLGFEEQVYYNNRTTNKVPDLHLKRTEQKLYLQLYLEDKQRRGKYH